MLDTLDKRILRHLQNEPESSVANIAEKATTTPSVVSRRLAKLQEEGYILGQELVLDWAALGFEVQVSLRITLDKDLKYKNFFRDKYIKINENFEKKKFLIVEFKFADECYEFVKLLSSKISNRFTKFSKYLFNLSILP